MVFEIRHNYSIWSIANSFAELADRKGVCIFELPYSIQSIDRGNSINRGQMLFTDRWTKWFAVQGRTARIIRAWQSCRHALIRTQLKFDSMQQIGDWVALGGCDEHVKLLLPVTNREPIQRAARG